MKKVLALIAAATLALALAACVSSTLGVDTDSDGVHAVATGAAEGTGTGNITIPEGYGLCINHIVESGSFHVTATTADGSKVVFDEDLTDNIANLVDVEPGDYNLAISAKGAKGTVDVIPYDKEAQAMADATLDDALAQAGTNAEEAGLVKSSESAAAK